MADIPDDVKHILRTPPAQAALLGYMEGQSEERWCAGWLTGLHTALLGDEAYEWLVEAAGGWFAWPGETDGEAKNYNGRDLVFVEGTLEDLRRLSR